MDPSNMRSEEISEDPIPIPQFTYFTRSSSPIDPVFPCVSNVTSRTPAAGAAASGSVAADSAAWGENQGNDGKGRC